MPPNAIGVHVKQTRELFGALCAAVLNQEGEDARASLLGEYIITGAVGQIHQNV